MATGQAKPLPEVTEETRPFWEAASAGRLVAQRCAECGAYRREVMPPTPNCPHCLSLNYQWAPVSGRGEVYTFVLVHRPFHPAFQEEVPYNVTIVKLEEGPTIMTNLVGCPNDAITVGMPVRVTFERASGEIALPKFTPA